MKQRSAGIAADFRDALKFDNFASQANYGQS
jgi:hypothetical protein